MTYFWNTPKPYAGDTKLWVQDAFQVKVATTAIGGYRGPAGAITIEHIAGKTLTDFHSEEIEDLSKVITTARNIYARAKIYNILTYARQENGKLYLSLIPYPQCTWREKIQGLYHVLFGGTVLQSQEVETIKAFFKNEIVDPSPAFIPKPQAAGKDPFCRPAVINAQKITDFILEDNTYHLAHDNRPKVANKSAPHFLIVPAGEAGHIQDASQIEKQRTHLLSIAQKTMRILSQEHYPTLLYIKRDGQELQGVQHTHGHVQGIQHFPTSYLDCARVFLRQLLPSALSKQEMNVRLNHYSTYKWE